MTLEPIFSPEHPTKYSINGISPWDWVMHDMACWNLAYLCVPQIDDFLGDTLTEYHRKTIPRLVGAIAAIASPEHARTYPGVRAAMQGDPSKARVALYSLSHLQTPIHAEDSWLYTARERLEAVCKRMKPTEPGPTNNHNNNVVAFRPRR